MRKSFTYNRKTIKLEDENTRSEDINHDDVILENITDTTIFPRPGIFSETMSRRNKYSTWKRVQGEVPGNPESLSSPTFNFSLTHFRPLEYSIPPRPWMAKVTGDPMVAKRPDFQTKFRGVMDKVKRPPARSSSFIIITIFFDKRRLTYRHLHHEHHRWYQLCKPDWLEEEVVEPLGASPNL